MKTKLGIVGITLAFIIAVAGCFALLLLIVASGGANTSSDLVTQDRGLKDFTVIEFSGVGSLYIKQGSAFEVEVEAPENIVDKITTKVENSVLKIDYESNSIFDLAQQSPIDIQVTMPQLKQIDLNGVGNIKSLAKLELTNLLLNIAGTGNLYLELEANNLTVNLDGLGNVELLGQVDKQEVTLQGTGSYQAFALLSKQAKVEIKGLGNAEVNVSEGLNAKISGTGNLTYKGNPNNVTKEVTGLGTINRKED